MKWRTDKPTANVIVAKCDEHYIILYRYNSLYYTKDDILVASQRIDKWADLEEEETVTDCDELEDAAEDSWFNYEYDYTEAGALYSQCYKDGYKAGANWQREQDHDACYQCEKDYDNVFFKGEQHAIKKLKEEAIEGKCINTWMAGVVIDTDYGCLYLPQNTFEISDKVKVIILKDE